MRLKNSLTASVLTGLRLMSRALSPSCAFDAIEAESHSGRRTRIIADFQEMEPELSEQAIYSEFEILCRLSMRSQ